MKFTESFLIALEKYRQSADSVAKCGRVLAQLELKPGYRVLDLGCGSGTFSRTIVPRIAPGGHVMGVDYTPEAISIARRLAANVETGRLTFEQGDGHCLRFADNTFDAALCISVLAFCQDPSQVLGELRRVLRPGGRLLVVNSDEDTRIYNGHDQVLGRRIQRAIADRAGDPWLGRRLAYLVRAAGFRILDEDISNKIERDFNPGTGGYTLAHGLRDHLLSQGLSTQAYEAWLADLEACALKGSYYYGVTSYAYLVEA